MHRARPSCGTPHAITPLMQPRRRPPHKNRCAHDPRTSLPAAPSISSPVLHPSFQRPCPRIVMNRPSAPCTAHAFRRLHHSHKRIVHQGFRKPHVTPCCLAPCTITNHKPGSAHTTPYTTHHTPHTTHHTTHHTPPPVPMPTVCPLCSGQQSIDSITWHE
jgi:hypothetical protein